MNVKYSRKAIFSFECFLDIYPSIMMSLGLFSLAGYVEIHSWIPQSWKEVDVLYPYNFVFS